MRCLALVICLAALALAGCGGGGNETVPNTDVTTVGVPRTDATTTTSSFAPTTTDAATTTGVATQSTATTEQALAQAAAAGNHGPRYFETPSHNIGCYVDRHSARCDIRERSWSPPPEPKSCIKIGLDFGQGLVVGPHRAEFVCAGDTSLGGKAVLAYGQSTRRGSLVCLSEQRGMTCRNNDNGHGFFLSRERYRIF